MAQILNVLLANTGDSLLSKQQCYHCLSYQRAQVLCNNGANEEMYVIMCRVHPWALALQPDITGKPSQQLKISLD